MEDIKKIITKPRIVMMSLTRIIMDFADKEKDSELYNASCEVMNLLITMRVRD